MMEAGKLRKRVRLQELTEKQNDFGEIVRSYTTYATVWAAVKPLQGRELQFAQQINAEVTYKITIRYKFNVTSEHRVIHRKKILEIISVINPEESDKSLVLMCKEFI